MLEPLLDRLSVLPEGWQDSRLARIAATEDDPLLFAYVYLRKHLRGPETGDKVTFSQVHYEWADHAKSWVSRDRRRDIYVAPRAMGKSSWWMLLLPIWAAAHGHVKFMASFSDSATQAELHLSSVKAELERNEKLRADFPDLCKPAKRYSGVTLSDNRAMLHTASGFVFAARGVDSGTLGLKVGAHRPDLIIIDDAEPGANYSAYQVEKRLSTITDVILALNDKARVVMVGTTTLTGSIIHQAVQHEVEPAAWISDEGFTVHHALPFDEAGESIWPERWSTEYLRSIEHSASFSKNFLNSPRTMDGEYWREEDYIYGDLASVSRRIIAIDPAVTTARTSDETGIAVVGYSAAARKAVVSECVGVRLKGEPLRRRILDLIARYPDVAEVVVERNQGGDMMAEAVFHQMPVPVRTIHNSERKEVRLERALSYYRRGAVMHAVRLPALEAQQCEFPRGIHDDLADSVSVALDHLAAPKKQPLRAAVR